MLDSIDRVPPCDLDAEAGVLGSVLLAPDCADDVSQIVDPRDFYDEANQLLARHLFEMRAAGTKIDPVLLVDRMKQAGDFEAMGGAAHLHRVGSAVPNAAHARYYARIVRQKSELRQLVEAGTQIVSDAFDGAGDVDGQLSVAETRVLAIRDRRGSAATVEIREAMSQALAQLDRRLSGEADEVLTTGFDALDAMLQGGLRAGQLVIVAARPSMGKSALALDIARLAAKQTNAHILLVSLEMSAAEIAERMLSAESSVTGYALRSGVLSDGDRQAVVDAAGRLSRLVVQIDDCSGLRVADIASRARRMRHKGGLDAIVIDYLQLLEPDDAKDRRDLQVSRMTRNLKGLAKQLQVPVICLAQLNRQTENNTGHRPRLHHLRESGAIEQDADVVMFVHREEYFLTGQAAEAERGKAEIIIGKQRNGPIGVVKLTWDADRARFLPADDWHDPEEAPPSAEDFGDYGGSVLS